VRPPLVLALQTTPQRIISTQSIYYAQRIGNNPAKYLWFFYAKGVIFESKDRLVGLIGFALLGVVMLFVRELLDFQ
jgi:hypothetical protein